MNIILSKEGFPFKTDTAAKIQAGRLKLKDFTVVPKDDGYAIQTEEVSPVGSPEPGAEKTHRVTQPWKPATLLDIPEHLKDPNFVYRFCNQESAGNIQKKKAEGWEIDKDLSRKMGQKKPTLEDGGSLDTTTGVRELIVMRMPKEMAQERNKYFAKLTDGGLKAVSSKLKADLQEAAGEYDETPDYGEVKVERY